MSRLILFDDGRAELGPLGDLRCSFEQRTGIFTGLGRAERSLELQAELHLMDGDGALASERTGRTLADPTDSADAIIVNGRLADGGALRVPDPGVVRTTADGSITIGRLAGDALLAFLADGSTGDARVEVDDAATCFTHPWDLLGALGDRVAADAALSDDSLPVPDGVVRFGEHAVHIGANARVLPTVVLDATDGPIWIDEGAEIRPGTVLCGPCAIGRECVITDRSLIKRGTSIGPGCKVGGEVKNTIFQGFSNKGHDGHLGDALVGEWVNIGAGTDNSNLLNTYAEVLMRLEHDGSLHRTGLVFMGCVLGDHVKLAIGTRVMTGTTIGTGAMVASSTPPPAFTRRFSWLTDAAPKTYQWRKFSSVVETVMARREITPGPAYLARLAALHVAAAGD